MSSKFISSTLAFFLIATLSLAANKPSRIQAEIARGQQLFEHGLYDQSVAVFKKLLDSYQLKRMEDIMAAHTNLGAAYYHLGNETKAKQHFQSLLNFNPTTKLDTTRFSPKVISFLENIKTTKKTTPTPITLATTNRISSHENRLIAFASPEPTPAASNHEAINKAVQTDLGNRESEYELLYRFMPFGVGQFRNEQKLKGWLFFAGESLALTTALTTMLLFDAGRNEDGTFENPGQASAYRTAFFSSMISFAALSVIGIADSLIVYNKQNK